MLQTISAAWLAAARKDGSEPVTLLEIVIDGTTTLKASYGHGNDATVATYPDSIESITPASVALDPRARTMSVSSSTVTMKPNGLGRSWATNYRLRGKHITLRLGFKDLAYADYVTTFGGQVDSARARRDGGLELRCSDPFGKVRDGSLNIAFRNRHPAQCIGDVLTACGLSAAEIDATSLDPSQAGFDANKHWTVFDMFASTPQPASTLIEELCFILGGCLRGQDTGVLQFVPWAPSSAPVGTFTDADFLRDTFEVADSEAFTTNRALISYDAITKILEHAEPKSYTYRTEDTAAQAAIAPYGGDPVVVAFERKLELLCAWGNLADVIAWDAGAGSTFRIIGTGFCGENGDASFASSAGNQPYPWARLDDTHTAYVKIESETKAPDEVIEIDRLTWTGIKTNVDGGVTFIPFDDPVSDVTYLPIPSYVEARIKTRGALGTTGSEHHGQFHGVFDITIPHTVAHRVVDRFRTGIAVLRFRTKLDCFAYQVGDIVSVDTDKFFAYGLANADAQKWEVIGKDTVLTGKDIGIGWTLAQVAVDLTGQTKTQTQFRRAPPPRDDPFRRVMGVVIDGCAVTAGTGLHAELAAGVLTFGGSSVGVRGCEIDLQATADTYIGWVFFSNALKVQATDIGVAPTNAYATWFAKVTTGASGVTGITDLRSSKALADGMVGELAIGDGAVLNRHLGSTGFDIGRFTLGSLDTGRIVAGSLTNAHLGATGFDIARFTLGTLNMGRIAAGSVTNLHLGTDLDAGKLTAGTLPGGRIAAGSIVNAHLGTDLDASKLTVGTLPGGRIGAGSILNAHLGSDLDAGKLTAGTLAVARLAAGSITNVYLGSDLDAAKLASGYLPNARIAADSLSAAQVGMNLRTRFANLNGRLLP